MTTMNLHVLGSLAEQIELLKQLKSQLAAVRQDVHGSPPKLSRIVTRLHSVDAYIGQACVCTSLATGMGAHASLANTVSTLVCTPEFSEMLYKYIQRQIDAMEERIRESLKEATDA